MPSRPILIALLIATTPLAAAEERPAPPPPEVRGPALPVPVAAAPTAVAPQAAEPKAEAPHAPEPAGPVVPFAPAQAGEARSPAGDAAAAAAAVRGLGKKGEPQGPPRDPPVPPSLTGRALAEELRRSAGGRASEKDVLSAERARLEKLAREIAEARAALKVETERLGALVKAAAAAPGPKEPKVAAKPGTKPALPPLETLARTVKSMKSDQAASLLGRVDRSLAAALLERMKPVEAGAVLERMDGATSAALVALIARKDSP